MGTRLFVGNLSYNVNEQELKEAFTTEGIEVRSVRVSLDRETGRPRGFAFVETMTEEGAKLSIEKLAGRILQGRSLIVEEAQARPAPGAPRPGGGPGGLGPPRPFGPPRPGGEHLQEPCRPRSDHDCEVDSGRPRKQERLRIHGRVTMTSQHRDELSVALSGSVYVVKQLAAEQPG